MWLKWTPDLDIPKFFGKKAIPLRSLNLGGNFCVQAEYQLIDKDLDQFRSESR
jgi:hypothetical protein